MRARMIVWTAVLATLALAAESKAHLDTLMQVENPPPLVKEFEADQCPGVPADLFVKDTQATGGVAVRASVGTPSFGVDFGELDRGMYVVYVVARVTGQEAMSGAFYKPLNIVMDLKTADGSTERWGMRVPFNDEYNEIAHLYFHAPVKGSYSAEIRVDRGSAVTPWVDRIQLRNMLGGLDFRAVKTKRVFFSDAEIARMRENAAREKKLPKPLRAQPIPADERAARDETMWNAGLPLNANYNQDVYPTVPALPKPFWEKIRPGLQEKAKVADLGQWTVEGGKSYDQPWKLVNKTLNLEYTQSDFNANNVFPAPWPIPEDKAGYLYEPGEWPVEKSTHYGSLPSLMNQLYNQMLKAVGGGYEARDTLTARYLLLGDEEAASDAAFLLAAYSYRYPGYDYQAHACIHVYKPGKRFQPSNNFGRGTGYSGWSTKAIDDVMLSYDALFPYIQGNEELARRVGRFVPWVKAPRDVVALIDTFLVQRAAEDGFTHILYSQAIPYAAVVLGPNELSQKILDQYFTRTYLRDTLCGFPDSIINGYSPDGLNYIGSSFYAPGESAMELGEITDLLTRYVRAGGPEKYNMGDPRVFARPSELATSMFDIFVAGGYSSNLGDVAAADNGPRLNPDPAGFPVVYRNAWLQRKDPRVAWWLVNRIGQGEMTDAEWAEVTQAAETAVDPIKHQQSRFLSGFGLAVMEEGGDQPDIRRKNTLTMRTGVASGHAHPDTLDIQFYSQGLRMLSDLGGRISRAYGRPTCMSTYVHNMVEVNEESFNGGVVNSTGTGWLEAFQPSPGAQFTLGAARAEGQPQVSQYRRATALISVDEGRNGGSPNAYVFDVFRVAGGKVHTWCFKGVPPDEFLTSSPLAEAKSETAVKYLSQHREGSALEGKAGDVLQASWRLRRAEQEVEVRGKKITLPNYEAKMLGKDYDPASPRKYTRVQLFGHDGDAVMAGNWTCNDFKGREFDWPLLYVRQENMARSTWPAVIQAYAGEPCVTGAVVLKATRTAAGETASALPAVAMELTTWNGYTDFLFQGDRNTKWSIEGGRTAGGDFGFVRTDADGPVLAHLVGGPELTAGRVSIQPERSAWEGAILAVDYARNEVVVAGAWPVAALAGQVLTISNAKHVTNAQIVEARADGPNTRLRFDRTALMYQGGLEYIDANGSAVLDLDPYLYDYHPAYYDGMTLVNEAGGSFGRLGVGKADRYMYMGWPEWRRYQQRIRPEDLVDADGDGRRVLKMYATEPTSYLKEDGSVATTQPGEFMLDLEVTRLGDDGLTFWYKQHPMNYVDALKAPHPGWPYHWQILKNEDGSKSWGSRLPGDTYKVSLDGGKLAEGDFPDPDGNGRALVRFYDYGPGDSVRLAVDVQVRRTQAGYEARTNVPVNVSVPGARAGLKPAGEWQPVR